MAIIKHNKRTFRATKPRHCKHCGAQVYYWGHDMDATGRQGSNFCPEHGSGSWVFLNRDETLHVCGDGLAPEQYEGDAATADDDEPEAPTTAPVAPSHAAGSDALSAALGPLADLLRPLLGAKVDESQVRAIVADALTGILAPLRIEVADRGEVRPVAGNAHVMLAKVVVILSAGLHVMMARPGWVRVSQRSPVRPPRVWGCRIMRSVSVRRHLLVRLWAT